MTVRIGKYELDVISYDADADVLYLGVGKQEPAARTVGTPEGHAVRFDEEGKVVGITIVNAKWLSERDGKIAITIPDLVEASAAEIAPALGAA